MIFNKTSILHRYGIFGSIRLAGDIVSTRLFFPGARIIRRPCYIRGKKQIHFGRNLTTGVGTRLDVFSEKNEKSLIFGDHVQLNDYVHIGAVKKVTIGNHVLIASKVLIIDHNHGSYNAADSSSPDTNPLSRKLHAEPVIIEDNVWIGEMSCILPGVCIGKGSIVGAGSVVSKSIPPYCLAAGNPARVIKQFDHNEQIWKNSKT